MTRGRRSVQTLVKGQLPLASDSKNSESALDVEVSTPAKDEVKTRPRAIDDMEGDALKEYARSIGITQRDVDGLTEGRLRQNCKARISVMLED